jgi:hypothetical protein
MAVNKKWIVNNRFGEEWILKEDTPVLVWNAPLILVSGNSFIFQGLSMTDKEEVVLLFALHQ